MRTYVRILSPRMQLTAETVGFEPTSATVALTSFVALPDYQSGAFSHSATSPSGEGEGI